MANWLMYRKRDDQRAFQRAWARRRRDEWLKAHGPCATCGSWQDLEVDHRERTEKVTHRVWSWAEARRAAELAKCQVLCRACHAAKTRAEQQRPVVHGTVTGYRKGCRCVSCCQTERIAHGARRATLRALGLPVT